MYPCAGVPLFLPSDIIDDVPYFENSAVALRHRVGTEAEGHDDSITDSRSDFASMEDEDEAVDELSDLAFTGADEMELDQEGVTREQMLEDALTVGSDG